MKLVLIHQLPRPTVSHVLWISSAQLALNSQKFSLNAALLGSVVLLAHLTQVYAVAKIKYVFKALLFLYSVLQVLITNKAPPQETNALL